MPLRHSFLLSFALTRRRRAARRAGVRRTDTRCPAPASSDARARHGPTLADRSAAAVVARLRARRLAHRRDGTGVAHERPDPHAAEVRRPGVRRRRGPALLSARRRGPDRRRRRHQGEAARGNHGRPPRRGEHDHAAARREHAPRPDRPPRHEPRAQAPRAAGGARDGAPLQQGADPRGVHQPDQLRPRLVRRGVGGAALLRQERVAPHARRGGDARRAAEVAGRLRSARASPTRRRRAAI